MPHFPDECPLLPPCFLHLFNLFAMPFEPFLGRRDITPSISIQDGFEMCIIHVLFMGLLGDQCANQLYWTPQRLQHYPVHLNTAQHRFLKSGVLHFVGGNDTFMGLPRTIVPLKGIMQLFHLPSDAHTSAGLGSPQPGLMRMVLSSRSDSDLGQDPAEVMGELWLSKKGLQFFLLSRGWKGYFREAPQSEDTHGE